MCFGGYNVFVTGPRKVSGPKFVEQCMGTFSEISRSRVFEEIAGSIVFTYRLSLTAPSGRVRVRTVNKQNFSLIHSIVYFTFKY